MLLHRFAAVVALCCLDYGSSIAQTAPPDSLGRKAAPTSSPAPNKWYEKISLRGYAQVRYNRLLETNPELNCEQCDRSWGKDQGFSLRRARLVFSGQAHERLFIYLQFDFAADPSSSNKHFLQVRDAYFDYAFDRKKDFRLRFGQSKVPYGFENLQSSSNRLSLDRSDALNSAAANERDLGAFVMYAPARVRERFKRLIDDGLKGSGDYGVLAIGLHNGQGANKPEANNNRHVIARASYPFSLGGQIIEPGLQAYSGLYTLSKEQLSTGVKYREDRTYTDRRVAASFVLYPQPFGLTAEYNIGESPTFDPLTDSIGVGKLHGGYVLASYRTKLRGMTVLPFVRLQTYDGAKKHETDARQYYVRETEVGVELQVFKNLELTLAYTMSHRTYHDFRADYNESGRLLRVQVQANY